MSSLTHPQNEVVLPSERPRPWYGPMITAGDPYPGGLFILLPLLIGPAYTAMGLPTGLAVLNSGALGIFAALFAVSQWITPKYPLALRLSCYAGLTAMTAWGEWALAPGWWAAAVLTAVACANLLVHMRGSVLGIAAVTLLSLLSGVPLSAAALVVASGAIAILRGRLLLEIARSRASRKAYATAAVDNERLRFARDLHDLLGHSLVTMMAKAELAERLAGVDAAASAAATKDVQAVGRTAMLEVQQAITGYRSTSLADEIDRASRSLDPLLNSVVVTMPDRIWPSPVDSVLAWGVREAVTNILRHADASECAITVESTGRSVRLDVVNDDLGGRSVETGGSGGHGLMGLRERARELGGDLTAGVRQGGGFRLTMELPIDADKPS
ncbi:histidine kinase [Streptomyces sp. NPDC021096]|uniref:sensor histidine kinase n=1 Tax=Streptomyces sp. NPDC021096 TaxID=3154792 RepID=UPI0033D8BB53